MKGNTEMNGYNYFIVLCVSHPFPMIGRQGHAISGVGLFATWLQPMNSQSSVCTTCGTQLGVEVVERKSL